MTLHDLDSADAVDAFKLAHPNVLICFSATWCSPCRASKPTLMDLADSYEKGERSQTHDLRVGIAYEHNLGDALHSKYGVKAFPTYVLWTGRGAKEEGRVEGANFDGIRKLIEKAGCKREMGEGHSLGGGGDHKLSAAEARAKRLEKLGGEGGGGGAAEPGALAKPAQDVEAGGTKVEPMEEDGKPEEAASAAAAAPASPAPEEARSEDVEMKDAGAGEAEIEMVDPTDSLKEEDVNSLTESMGFALVRAQKGLLYGGGTVEGAVEWLMAHQDDDDIDDPVPKVPRAEEDGGGGGDGGVAQSYKCNECGKVLSSMANLELHANKTGHSDFEESTDKIKPLTAEEKAKKIEEIKALLKAKRNEREEAEKVDEVQREKQRRFMGKEMTKTKEEMERQARMREAKQRRREKEAFKRERERIRAELAKDKAERQANKGKLHSKLGAEGYNPDAIQYDAPAAAGGAEGGGADANADAPLAKPKPKAAGNPAKIDEYIKKVSSYRAGGDGKNCLKILLAYVSNVVDKPDEVKFRTIKMDNKAYKAKVKPFLGAKSLLVAVGFLQSEDGDTLVLREDADRAFLAETKAKLAKAYSEY